MRTGLSNRVLTILRKHPRIARQLSLSAPFAVRRHWLVRQLLKDQAGSRAIVKTKLDNGMQIQVFIGDVPGDEIYTYGVSEPATVSLIRCLLDKDTLFFDVGAHVGMYTLLAAPLAQKVYSFEPMPWIYELLESNVRYNKLNNVTIERKGARDFTGQAEIWEGPKDNSGSSSFLRIPGFYSRSYSVECVTLDSYCQASRLELRSRKVLLKIDVERAELEVLKGAVTLFEYQPSVIIEFNDWSTDLEEVVRFFHDQEYTLEAILPSGLKQFVLAEWLGREREDKVINVLAKPMGH
jgi:FkbM family methyltransferase